jgi:DNA-binding XRE family transcriptional regulator
MTNLRDIFAHNLKEKRRNCGFSQAKLAEMVNVSVHHIATIETARN